jgi:hypothetical protein
MADYEASVDIQGGGPIKISASSQGNFVRLILGDLDRGGLAWSALLTQRQALDFAYALGEAVERLIDADVGPGAK